MAYVRAHQQDGSDGKEGGDGGNVKVLVGIDGVGFSVFDTLQDFLDPYLRAADSEGFVAWCHELV